MRRFLEIGVGGVENVWYVALRIPVDQWFGFPRQHVGAIMHKPLIFSEPGVPARARALGGFNGSLAVRHWVGRVRYVVIGPGFVGWFVKRQAAVGTEIQITFNGFDGGPLGVGFPLVRAGLKSGHFRSLTIAFSFQVIRKPGRKHCLAERTGCGGIEADVAQLTPFSPAQPP